MSLPDPISAGIGRGEMTAMPVREPMPPAKAFWNALVVAFLPVLAMSVFLIYFLKPERHELLNLLGILALVFGVPGIILCALQYRGYRMPPRPENWTTRKLIALGISLLLCAAGIIVAALAPLVNQRHVDRWDLWSSLGAAVPSVVFGIDVLYRGGAFRRRSAQADENGPSIRN